jgi:hypothetical protein
VISLVHIGLFLCFVGEINPAAAGWYLCEVGEFGLAVFAARGRWWFGEGVPPGGVAFGVGGEGFGEVICGRDVVPNANDEDSLAFLWHAVLRRVNDFVANGVSHVSEGCNDEVKCFSFFVCCKSSYVLNEEHFGLRAFEQGSKLKEEFATRVV